MPSGPPQPREDSGCSGAPSGPVSLPGAEPGPARPQRVPPFAHSDSKPRLAPVSLQFLQCLENWFAVGDRPQRSLTRPARAVRGWLGSDTLNAHSDIPQ